jgi:hypothetical protein
MQFLVFTLFNFHWKNGSIINSFHTIAPNSLKPSWCTPAHWELSKDTKSVTYNVLIWEILVWQTKQNKTNYLVSKIDVTSLHTQSFFSFCFPLNLSSIRGMCQIWLVVKHLLRLFWLWQVWFAFNLTFDIYIRCTTLLIWSTFHHPQCEITTSTKKRVEEM